MQFQALGPTLAVLAGVGAGAVRDRQHPAAAAGRRLAQHQPLRDHPVAVRLRRAVGRHRHVRGDAADRDADHRLRATSRPPARSPSCCRAPARSTCPSAAALDGGGEKPFSHGRGNASPRSRMARAGRRVTIHDVASAAGVSIATASKALNDTGRVGAETRARVKRVAAEIGFRPNALARGLLSEAQLHHRAPDQRHLRPLHPAGDGRHQPGAGRPPHLGLPLRHRGRPGARPDPRRGDARQAGRRHHRLGQARRPPAAGRPRPPAGAGGLRLHRGHARRGDAALRRRAGRDARGGASRALGRRRIAHVTGPESFFSVRERAGAYRALAGDAIPVAYGPWSEAWGHAAVAGSGPPPSRRTRSSAATTRSPAAPSTRCASGACGCPRTSRSSASTTGRSSRRRPARR